MNEYSFEQATVVLFNPSGEMRSTLRDVLNTLGFGRIVDCSSLERTRQALVDYPADLLIVDLDRHKAEVCELVRDVRHGRLSGDPFIVISALSWNPHTESVNFTMEAGVDDIISMPLSVKLLSERIDYLIRNRKPFVVTSSYVGPDRRTKERAQNDELGTIDVPNNLRYKATGDESAAARDDAISRIQATVDHHRITRHAQRIRWLLDQIEMDHSEQSADTDRTLAELSELVEELGMEIESQGYEELLDICASMERVIEALGRGPSRRLYELLRVHTLAVTATLMDRKGASELVVQALNEATERLDQHAEG